MKLRRNYILIRGATCLGAGARVPGRLIGSEPWFMAPNLLNSSVKEPVTKSEESFIIRYASETKALDFLQTGQIVTKMIHHHRGAEALLY